MRTRDAAWLLLVVWVVACGGPAAPAESPPPSNAPDVAPAAHEPADAVASEPAAPAASDKPASSAPASDADVSAVLQLVLDDPELDQYLHLGQPGRFPLQIAGEKLPSGLKLVKATEPVKVVERPKSDKDAVLVFTDIDVQGDKASVRYRYDIEGVRATVTLAKTSHGWELKNSRLVER